MNDYMRENKLEPVALQLSAETVAQAAEAKPEERARCRQSRRQGDGQDRLRSRPTSPATSRAAKTVAR